MHSTFLMYGESLASQNGIGGVSCNTGADELRTNVVAGFVYFDEGKQ
jgi:hypothetical protein